MFPIHDDTERVHGRPYLNYGMIAINVVVFIWEASATSFFTDEQAVQDLFMTYGAVPKGQDLYGNCGILPLYYPNTCPHLHPAMVRNAGGVRGDRPAGAGRRIWRSVPCTRWRLRRRRRSRICVEGAP